jgi:hypothetical protein
VVAVELDPRDVQEAEEGLEHTSPLNGAGFEHRLAAFVGERADFVVGSHALEVPLVELNDERKLLEIDAEILEILAQVEERGRVVLGLGHLRIGDERHTVGPLQDEAPRGRVQDLAGHRKNLDTQGHSARRAVALGPEREREHVEEEGTVVFRLEGHQAPACVFGRKLVQRLQVRRLAAERRSVINELERYLSTTEVYLHDPSFLILAL